MRWWITPFALALALNGGAQAQEQGEAPRVASPMVPGPPPAGVRPGDMPPLPPPPPEEAPADEGPTGKPLFLFDGGAGAPPPPPAAVGAEAPAPAVRGPAPPLDAVQESWSEGKTGPGQVSPGVKVVDYRTEAIPTVRVRIAAATTIVLPRWERVLEGGVILADPEVFGAERDGNRAHQVQVWTHNAGADTTLRIQGEERDYVFRLVSEGVDAEAPPDVRVLVRVGEGRRLGLIAPAVLEDRWQWQAAALVHRPQPAPAAAPAPVLPVAAVSGRAFPPVGAPAAAGDPVAGGDDYVRDVPGLRLSDLVTDEYEVRLATDKAGRIAPERVFHDGRFTYIDFGEDADGQWRPVPKRLVDGIEVPVNRRFAGPRREIMVVEWVGDLVLRHDRQVVCLTHHPGGVPQDAPEADEGPAAAPVFYDHG